MRRKRSFLIPRCATHLALMLPLGIWEIACMSLFRTERRNNLRLNDEDFSPHNQALSKWITAISNCRGTGQAAQDSEHTVVFAPHGLCTCCSSLPQPETPRLIISVSHHFLDMAWLILVLMTFYDVSCEKYSNSLIRLSIYSLHWDRHC